MISRCIAVIAGWLLASQVALAANDPADGPVAYRVYPVAEDELAVEIVEGRVVNNGQVPYTPMEGDELDPTEDDLVLAYDESGEPAMVPKNVEVRRQVEGSEKVIGFYLEKEGLLSLKDERLGPPLDLDAALDTASYLLSSEEDANYAAAKSPLSLARKSKPIEGGRSGAGQQIRHRFYLKLPSPLQAGARYTLSLAALNTQEESVEYLHDTSAVWNEAIHANQVGYHPQDAYKRGLLSLWKGTGGSHDFDAWVGEPFKLVETLSGQAVFTGSIQKIMDETEVDSAFKNQANNAQTSVYALDFSEFNGSGRFRIHIEGLGVSHAFVIAPGVWTHAHRVSMMGMLHHRSGIELGPPFTDYRRPLNFHPDNGDRILQTDTTILHGESSAIKESLTRLAGSAEEVPEAWGGYLDAGDWDRRSQHLETSYLHLELFDLFPAFYERLSLRLPPEEAENAIPDILDEALWNIEFYQRIQLANGAVRGGVESTAHPRTGEASWQESLLIGAFAPDPVTSYRFAANAAKAARLLEDYDPGKAAGLKASAERAWTWAEAEAQAVLDTLPDGRLASAEGAIAEQRPLAAVELFWLTRKAAYAAVAEEALAAVVANPATGSEYRDALFAYALMPEGLGDAAIKQAAAVAFAELGDIAIGFQNGNAYGIATDIPGLPMMGYVGYYSVPQMINRSLPRAHLLTGEEKYRTAAVAACNFPNGANPDNLVYTTGLGEHHPVAPLHIDSRVTGQPAPEGITIYGPSDPAEGYDFLEWVHVWRLSDSMVPNSRAWPAAEWHLDLFDVPAMSEYTVHQCIGPTSYYWGYLAAAHGDLAGEIRGIGADLDGDALEDALEYAIIDAHPDDGIDSLEDVLPMDDFDRDGLSNLEEIDGDSHPAIPGMGRLSLYQESPDEMKALFAQGESGPFQFFVSQDLADWSPRGPAFDSLGATHKADLDPALAQRIFVRVERTGLE